MFLPLSLIFGTSKLLQSPSALSSHTHFQLVLDSTPILEDDLNVNGEVLGCAESIVVLSPISCPCTCVNSCMSSGHAPCLIDSSGSSNMGRRTQQATTCPCEELSPEPKQRGWLSWLKSSKLRNLRHFRNFQVWRVSTSQSAGQGNLRQSKVCIYIKSLSRHHKCQAATVWRPHPFRQQQYNKAICDTIKFRFRKFGGPLQKLSWPASETFVARFIIRGPASETACPNLVECRDITQEGTLTVKGNR